MDSSHSYVKYDEMTPWAIKLDSVTKDENEGTYHVKLVQFVSGRGSRIIKEINCVLKERPDGSLYFRKIFEKYPDQEQLVSIKGKYQKLDPKKLAPCPGNKEYPFQVLADFDGKVFTRSVNVRQGSDYEDCLCVYSARDFKKLMQLKSPRQFLRVKQTPDAYLLICSDSIIYLDKDLKNRKIVRLPVPVREACQGDWWGSFDVSEDGRYFVYSSKTKGLMLYDTETAGEKLLTNHFPENIKFNYIPYIQGPVFVDNDNKVVANISGYEGLEGYLMADLHTFEIKKLTEAEFRDFDSSLPAALGIYTQAADPDGTEKPMIGIARLDYSKMEISKSRVFIGDNVQRNLLGGEGGAFSAYNDQYLAYITVQYSQTDPADNVYHLVRIHLDSMQAETILTIKAGFPSILGMLDNGQVIFSYSFENQYGIGMTERVKANE